MEADSMKRIKEILNNYLMGKKEVKAAYLFGSTVAGKDVAGSDVDIALLTEPYKDRMDSYRARVRCQAEISRLIGRDVDLVFLQEAGELLSFQILEKGEVIFERDKEVHRGFTASRVVQCLDFRFLRERMEKGMIAAMRNEIGR